MTGVLLIDKPSGPTSHDVVARMRRATGERSIGHAGTLDPAATGLLVLLLGNATRLASLLTGHDKTYEATIRFGFATTTDDAQGERIADGPSGPAPADDAIRAALDAMRGDLAQIPPQFSAKRVDGTQAYKFARRDQAVELKPSAVALRDWWWLGRDGDEVRIGMTSSAGFYVRSLARDLGQHLGCGAHIATLRRTRSGGLDLRQALPLAEAEAAGPDVSLRLIPMADALPELPRVVVSEAGLVRVRHGNPVGPQLIDGAWVPASAGASKIRLVTPAGDLVALADLRGGLLHPSAVVG